MINRTEYEVPNPILNSPYEEPQEHWLIREGELPVRLAGRRTAGYFYRDPRAPVGKDEHTARGEWRELDRVNLIRERVVEWRTQGYPGATRTTADLLAYWRREERDRKLFFAQIEAAETIIFLTEGRQDLRQGTDVPMEELSAERMELGYQAFRRLACKMATGTGKTTVMAMLAAWSILNKVHDRSDSRFSDVVLVVCPNVTIRSRLAELDPRNMEGSLYRKRDIVPPHLMGDLAKGRVLVTNWHIFELQAPQVGGSSARVVKTGVPVTKRIRVYIGPKTTTMRDMKYFTLADYRKHVAAGNFTNVDEERDLAGNLIRAKVDTHERVESDTGMVNRVLGREVGGKQNILVFNDEAHHAYRIQKAEADQAELDLEDEDDADDTFVKEATVWIDGLDRINKLRGINVCVDFSATPYYIGRVGEATNEVFPWIVSDFGLVDAIESGLVKIPQLAVRDTTGADISCYFNIWHWILPKLTPRERGGKKANPDPVAVLKWAHHPLSLLGGLWRDLRKTWLEKHIGDPRPPVYIVVCKNTKIAKMLHAWLSGEGDQPAGVPACDIAEFRNTNGAKNTIRVDTKVVDETDTGNAKSDDNLWMRFTLDTVGKTEWPCNNQGQPLYPEGFEELAKKLENPLHPPGRDVRCIVSVGMLTEGWDCNTVTHIVGLRPFMSQLLCEQVVGRGLRRADYEVGEDGKLREEVAQILGVPFEMIPFKANKTGDTKPPVARHHVHAIAEKAPYEITVPRVEGYAQAVKNKVAVDWESVAHVRLDPGNIPPEVQMKAGLPTNEGRYTLSGPGKLTDIDLRSWRKGHRIQELVFELARDLTREYAKQATCEIPKYVLFPQLVGIVRTFIEKKVQPIPPASRIDVFLAPYYGWVLERLRDSIHPDTTQGEAPEIPRYELGRGPCSTAEVSFQTSRDVREVIHSHLNYVVADTKVWEQSAAYVLDTHELVETFAKTDGLGFTIPYFHNGEPHDYRPDFIVRLKGEPIRHLILETKGYDPIMAVKKQAADRWVRAVNADGRYGIWSYAIARAPEDVAKRIEWTAAATEVGA